MYNVENDDKLEGLIIQIGQHDKSFHLNGVGRKFFMAADGSGKLWEGQYRNN
jgi:hypothetical protein